MNFGNYCSKGSWAAVRKRNAESDCSVGMTLPGMVWGEQLYHGLAAFAGDWAQWRSTRDELISAHLS